MAEQTYTERITAALAQPKGEGNWHHVEDIMAATGIPEHPLQCLLDAMYTKGLVNNTGSHWKLRQPKPADTTEPGFYPGKSIMD